MYGGSEFDGSAAFAGGGFMPSQATQTPESTFAPAKSRDTLLPLTLKQINDAIISGTGRSELVIDGVDVGNVKLVGIVHEKTERTSDVAFVLDDGTGRIECNKWLQDDVDANEMEQILKGIYVSVHGALKDFQGRKSVTVFSVRPVDDHDEIACHFIECIYVHFYNTRLRKLESGINTQLQSSHSTQPQMTNIPNHPSGQYISAGKKCIEDMILDVMHEHIYLARPEGIHVDQISQKLKIPTDKLRVPIENLLQETKIYSTIDDFHYKSVLNG